MPEDSATAPEASVSSRTASGRGGRKWLLGLAAGLVLLVVGALLHDIGKPATKSVYDTGRIRFLGHHEEGARIAAQVLTRLRFSRRGVDHVAHDLLHRSGEPKGWKCLYRFFTCRRV